MKPRSQILLFGARGGAVSDGEKEEIRGALVIEGEIEDESFVWFHSDGEKFSSVVSGINDMTWSEKM